MHDKDLFPEIHLITTQCITPQIIRVISTQDSTIEGYSLISCMEQMLKFN